MTRSIQHRLKIDAPFIFCDSCKGCGWRDGFSYQMCGKCNGTGRIYFQFEPGFVTRFRNWWERLPIYKRRGYIGCAFMLTGSILAIAAIQIAEKVWP